MYNPNDDPDIISGLCDDAKKEMATTPGTSQEGHSEEWGFFFSGSSH